MFVGGSAGVNWSEEYSFTGETIRRFAPESPAVYRILHSEEYPRYRGTTRVLKIGKSGRNLRDELLNHLGRHAAANRLDRIRQRAGIRLSFRYSMVREEDARHLEKLLLRRFEEDHWDLPVLNSHRGYTRGEDSHFRK